MPALQLFLIGAPRSGRTTVFRALTNTPEGQHSSTKGTHHLGTVKVPDDRLAQLRDLFNPKKYTPAVQAAGKIHTDLERGFIRAEVVRYGDLLAVGSLGHCREKGTLKLEGKAYIVQDGDIMHIRFNA